MNFFSRFLRSTTNQTPTFSVSEFIAPESEVQSSERKLKSLVMEFYGKEVEKYSNLSSDDLKDKISLITSYPQSGKTFEMISLIHLVLLTERNPIVVLKQIKQKEQFINRYNAKTKELIQYLLSKGVNKCVVYEYYFNQPLHYDSDFGKDYTKDKYIQDVERVIEKNEKQLFVFIDHHATMTRFYERVHETDKKFVLFIDEAHCLGAYKKLGLNGANIFNPRVKYDKVISKMKERSDKVFLITATPQNVLNAEPLLYSNNIFKVDMKDEYNGIKNIVFNIIDEDKDESLPQNTLLKVVKKLSVKDVYTRKLDGKVDYHPVNLLLKVENTNIKQDMTQDFFNPLKNDSMPQVIKDGKWTTLVYNQKGFRLYSPNLNGDITICGKNFHQDPQTGYYRLKNLEVGDVYHYLASNGGVVKFPRIATIAYNAATEGITYCSTWNPVENYRWHLTDALFMVGKKTDAANLEQSFGRLFGNHGDDMKMNIWCGRKDKVNLMKGFNLHTELVEEMVNLPEPVNVKDYLIGKVYFKNRVPSVIFKIKETSRNLTKVNNPNKKEEENAMKNHYAQNILRTTNTLFEDLEEVRVSQEQDFNQIKNKCIFVYISQDTIDRLETKYDYKFTDKIVDTNKPYLSSDIIKNTRIRSTLWMKYNNNEKTIIDRNGLFLYKLNRRYYIINVEN